MKCPDDGAKITTKHYDPEFEWYECPKCEGCFTADELEEAETGTSPRRRAQNARSTSEQVKEGLTRVPLAKGKKRRTEIADDEAAIAEFEKKALVPVAKQTGPTRHRDEIRTREVVNIMADEIMAVYEEDGARLDIENARDKALIIWRELHHMQSVSAREQSVKIAYCKDHR